jgi:drug/metabolite transporter (DMT)-like permease
MYSILTALAWAVAVVLFRRTGEVMPPVALNLFKGLVGLVLSLVTMVALGVPFVPEGVTLADTLMLFGSGLVGIGIADTLFFMALNRLGAARLAVVDCAYSPFMILTSWVYLGEPISVWLGPAVVLMGAAIVIGAWEPGSFDAAAWKREKSGMALATLSVFLMAVSIVAVKPILNRTDVWWALVIRLAGGVAFLAVQGSFPRHRASVLRALTPGPAWRLAIPAALVGTYLAIFLWTLGMKLTYTNTASVLNQLSNVFILPLAAFFLHERLGPRQVAAILLGFGAGILAIL